jgi:hypothetical protein
MLKIRINLLEKIRDQNKTRTRDSLNAFHFDELKVNYLPAIIAVLFYSGLLYFLYTVTPMLAEFLFWFVGVLEISKVLKLPILQDPKVFEYPGLALFVYIGISILLDLKSQLDSLAGKRLFYVRDRWIIREKKMFSTDETILPEKISGLVIVYKKGFFRNLFGTNRLEFRLGNQIYLSAPFFPGSNKAILNRIQ